METKFADQMFAWLIIELSILNVELLLYIRKVINKLSFGWKEYQALYRRWYRKSACSCLCETNLEIVF